MTCEAEVEVRRRGGGGEKGVGGGEAWGCSKQGTAAYGDGGMLQQAREAAYGDGAVSPSAGA